MRRQGRRHNGPAGETAGLLPLDRAPIRLRGHGYTPALHGGRGRRWPHDVVVSRCSGRGCFELTAHRRFVERVVVGAPPVDGAHHMPGGRSALQGSSRGKHPAWDVAFGALARPSMVMTWPSPGRQAGARLSRLRRRAHAGANWWWRSDVGNGHAECSRRNCNQQRERTRPCPEGACRCGHGDGMVMDSVSIHLLVSAQCAPSTPQGRLNDPLASRSCGGQAKLRRTND